MNHIQLPDTILLTRIFPSFSEWSWNVAYMEAILNLHQKPGWNRKRVKEKLKKRCQHQNPTSDHPRKLCLTEGGNNSIECIIAPRSSNYWLVESSCFVFIEHMIYFTSLIYLLFASFHENVVSLREVIFVSFAHSCYLNLQSVPGV